jgi:hypothetical protein
LGAELLNLRTDVTWSVGGLVPEPRVFLFEFGNTAEARVSTNSRVRLKQETNISMVSNSSRLR